MKDKQKEKYFSPEETAKRNKKNIVYRQNSRKRQIEKGKNISRFSQKMIELHEKDAIFYREIWDTRKHYCENCNKYLGDSFLDNNGNIIVYRYAHIIPKSIYPYLRHYDKNIMLLCLNCHTQFDNSPKEIVQNMKCYDEEHIEELKLLHKKLKEEQDCQYK